MKLPKYVKLGSTALILQGEEYYRDAGAWGVAFTIKDNKIIANEPGIGLLSHIHGMELIECTEQEWKKSNEGYV